MSSDKHFFFLVDFLFTTEEIHFRVWDGPIAEPQLPKGDEDTEHGDTDITARGGSGISQVFIWCARIRKAYVTKSAVWNVGPTNASKPLNNAIIAVHTRPNQAAYGWNGACSATVREGEVFHDGGLTNLVGKCIARDPLSFETLVASQ